MAARLTPSHESSREPSRELPAERSCELYLVRHAPALTKGLCYGRSDVPVAPCAELAAEHVLAQLPRDLESLYCSPSRRTHELALVLAARTRLPLAVEPRLCELDFGAWEGRTWDEIHVRDPGALRTWAEAPLLRAPTQGETGHALLARVLEFTCKLAPKRTLLVCHAGTIRALRALAALPPHRRHPEVVQSLDFTRPVEPLAVERLDWS